MTLTATVLSGSHPVSQGIVTFCDASAPFCEDTAVFGTASVLANGTASIKIVLSPGPHSVYALFNLTQTDTGSKSEPQTFTVGPRIPTATVLSKLAAADPFSLQATITVPGTPPIEGMVTLIDDASPLSMVSEVQQSVLTSSFAPLSSYISMPINGPGLYPPGEMVTGDFNGDGLMDVAVTLSYGTDVPVAGVIFFLNDPAHPGQFIPGPELDIASGTSNLVAGDFNHDGLTDLAVGCEYLTIDENGGTYSFGECLLLNDPSQPGQFTLTTFSPVGAFLQAADMNQDGILDLVGLANGNVDIIFGDPAHPGQFVNETSFPDGHANALAVADLNGDGLPDVAATDGSGVSVFLADPHSPGKLLAPVSYPTDGLYGIVIGDFDHHGRPDLAVLSNRQVNVLLNQPDAPGQFSAPVTYRVGSGAVNLTVGAFLGKDSLDIAVLAPSGVNVLPADPLHPGKFLSAVTYPLDLGPGNYPSNLAVADYNADGLNDFAIDYQTPSSTTFNLGVLLSQPAQTATVDFSIPPADLSNGLHTLTAKYSGDQFHLPSSGKLAETIEPSTAAPAFSPAAGTYLLPQSVALASATPGATIYYTTNGQLPSTGSNVYTLPILVAATQQINAIAVAPGYLPSPVASANYIINSTSKIDFHDGFANAAAQMQFNGSVSLAGTRLLLTNGAKDQAGSAFYETSKNIQSFTTDFEFDLSKASGDGFTFAIQGLGPGALGSTGGALGYGSITKSVAIKFDLYNNLTEGRDSTGLYIDGAAPTTPAINLLTTGIDLHSGHPMSAHITYDTAYSGGELTLTITDETTKAAWSNSFAVDIPKAVGGPTAYLGFTGGTGDLTANQAITSWTYQVGAGATP